LLREQLEGVTTTTTTTTAAAAAAEHTKGTATGPSSSRLHTICAAEIYDDLFRQVRVWARMGYDAQAIQLEMDSRFLELEQSLVAAVVSAQGYQSSDGVIAAILGSGADEGPNREEVRRG
jgi:hypothetical protein